MAVGLRTLVVATAIIPEAFYEDWKHTYYRASTSVQNRQRNLDEAAELIERVSNRLRCVECRLKLSASGCSFWMHLVWNFDRCHSCCVMAWPRSVTCFIRLIVCVCVESAAYRGNCHRGQTARGYCYELFTIFRIYFSLSLLLSSSVFNLFVLSALGLTDLWCVRARRSWVRSAVVWFCPGNQQT